MKVFSLLGSTTRSVNQLITNHAKNKGQIINLKK